MVVLRSHDGFDSVLFHRLQQLPGDRDRHRNADGGIRTELHALERETEIDERLLTSPENCATYSGPAIPVRSAQRIGLGVPLRANNVDVDAAGLYAGEFLHVGVHDAERVRIEGIDGERMPMIMPGITISTKPDDFTPFRTLRIATFDGTSWTPSGDPISAE
jgi:hypothetical protein